MSNYAIVLVLCFAIFLLQLSSKIAIDLEKSGHINTAVYQSSLMAVWFSILLGSQSLYRLYRRAERTIKWGKSQS